MCESISDACLHLSRPGLSVSLGCIIIRVCVAAASLVATCDVVMLSFLKYKIFTLFTLKSKGSHIFVNGKGDVKSRHD